jgi:hypothetical protein
MVYSSIPQQQKENLFGKEEKPAKESKDSTKDSAAKDSATKDSGSKDSGTKDSGSKEKKTDRSAKKK